MSGMTPSAMPPLPRLRNPTELVTVWNQLCNALEQQMRRLLAPQAITDVPDVGQTATGFNQATAFQVTSSLTIFTTVGPGTGAKVPVSIGKGLLVNAGANNLTLYAAVGGTIMGGASVTVVAGAQVWWSVGSATVAYAA